MIEGYKEYTDIIREDIFRAECMDYLGTCLGKTLLVPTVLPTLYKYRRLSKHSVEDICAGRFTATAIGEFNDIFDGAIQEKSSQCLSRRAFSDFNMADYVGTYVHCLSEQNNSMLMWSHYADENKGICIEYDFNAEDDNSLLRRCLFPVTYSNEPINVLPLIEHTTEREYSYPHDIAILCAALNKSEKWSYENEWRYVEIDVAAKTRRLFRDCVVPNRIIFGNRFLKPMFYYSNDGPDVKSGCASHYDLIMKLLDYMDCEGITGEIAVPKLGSFELQTLKMNPAALKKFMQKSILAHSKCYEMHLYNEIYYKLICFLEKQP